MIRFLVRLALFVALIVGVLWALTTVIDARLRRVSTGRMQSWRQMRSGCINADVLISGNSHARVQIDPSVIEAAFPGRRCYNLGIEGYGFDTEVSRYDFYRRYNRRPRLLIQCADYAVFTASRWKADRIQFLPYIDDAALRENLHRIGFPKWKLSLPFLKYFGEPGAALAALTGRTPLQDDNTGQKANGFSPVDRYWSDADFREALRRHAFPAAKIEAGSRSLFEALARRCRAEDVKLIVVFTPHQQRFCEQIADAAAGYRSKVAAMVVDNGATFIDFSNLPLCQDTSFFYNGSHLNRKGAAIFSAALADSLRLHFHE